MAGHRQPIGHAGTPTTFGRPPVPAVDADTYGSTSTLSAETAAGWYVLMVDNYSRINKEFNATGWLVQSTAFTVGRCSWRMRVTYSPIGSSQDNAGWICFGLSLSPEPPGGGDGPVPDAMVRTRYSLLGQAGQLLRWSSTRIDDSVRTLSSMLGSWTCTPFMERERFESSSYVNNDRFSVRCDVTVVTRTCRLSGVVPPPDLRRHLGDLLGSGVGADVTLEVGGEAFPAHRSVLAARSPVFRAELFGGPPDKEDAAATTRRVRIRDIEPSVFKALLHFIYTDSLPEIDAGDETMMARRLLVAAQRYELEGLKRMCEDVLCILCPRRAAEQLPSLLDQMRAKVDGCPL